VRRGIGCLLRSRAGGVKAEQGYGSWRYDALIGSQDSLPGAVALGRLGHEALLTMTLSSPCVALAHIGGSGSRRTLVVG